MKDVKTLYAQRLKGLSPNITPEDKAEAINTIPISRPTLDNYLTGDIDNIKKLETAEALVIFFTSRLQNRIDKLRETNLV